MATIRLPNDFKEFLQLLNSEKVEYLLVGGYAVGCFGYPRATGDLDIWMARSPANAEALSRTLRRFGFSAVAVPPDRFLAEGRVFRIGVPPLRIDLLTNATGVDFSECYARRLEREIDGVKVSLIHLDDLKANKQACGRTKDLDDLEHLG